MRFHFVGSKRGARQLSNWNRRIGSRFAFNKQTWRKLYYEHGFIEEIVIDELKDLYSAETQLVKALPKMAKKARRRN